MMRDAYRYKGAGLDKRQARRRARKDRRWYVSTPRCEYYCGACGTVYWKGYKAEARSGPISLIYADCPSGHNHLAYRDDGPYPCRLHSLTDRNRLGRYRWNCACGEDSFETFPTKARARANWRWHAERTALEQLTLPHPPTKL